LEDRRLRLRLREEEGSPRRLCPPVPTSACAC